MNARTPLFSIITPTFNRADVIERTIRSVQGQTCAEWELLIVDDGSTDSTREVVEECMRNDPRIRLLAISDNSGLPAVPRNRGVTEARGELIAFLDSDDYWWPRHLEHHVRFRARTSSRGLCYSHLWTRRPGLPLFGLLFLPSSPQQPHTRQQLLRRNSIQCSAVSVPRALLTTVGGFNESPGLTAVEDYDLWLRCAHLAPMGFISHVTGVYTRAHGISAQRDMEIQLANLSEEIGEPVGRRSRSAVAMERIWGVPSALVSFGFSALAGRLHAP
jgi:teichuronic acid biosynthesis glycosyltransferase TuaG